MLNSRLQWLFPCHNYPSAFQLDALDKNTCLFFTKRHSKVLFLPPSLHLPSPLGALCSCSSVPNHSTVLSGFGSTFTVHTINYVSVHFPITSPISLSPSLSLSFYASPVGSRSDVYCAVASRNMLNEAGNCKTREPDTGHRPQWRL